MPLPTPLARQARWRAAAAGVLCGALVLTSAACVGRKGNNDGPKRQGEPNPAQPYADERQELETESQRSSG